MVQANGSEMSTFAADPDAAMAAYLKLGYHIEPDVWSPDECDALARASAKLPTAIDETFGPAMQAHRLLPEFLTALRNPGIVRIMERLVGGRVSAIQSEFFFCRPGTVGFSAHQDNRYVEAKADVFASAWTPLQNVTVDMGGLILWPGSHREGILPLRDVDAIRDAGQDPNAHLQEAVLPPGYEPVDMPVPKGAVLFLHAQIVHASHRNRSDKFRRVLLTTYIRSGESFRPGGFARRAEVDVYS